MHALIVVTAASAVLSQAESTQLVAESGWTVLVYGASAWAPPRVSAATVAGCSVAVLVEVLVAPGQVKSTPDEWARSWIMVGLVWGFGVLVRRARLRADRERDGEAAGWIRTRLDDERHRIARELHDMVAHHASAVAVQASAARSDPATLPAAVAHIQQGGNRIAEAVTGLADLGSPPAPLVPLTRDGIERTVGSVRAAGLPVAVRVVGTVAAELGEADLFGHRILLEALTNVLRHAGRSPTVVSVRHAEGEVVVEVRDSGVTPGHRPSTSGSGLGLVGMRERAVLLGGEVEAGPADGGWLVRARLPRA